MIGGDTEYEKQAVGYSSDPDVLLGNGHPNAAIRIAAAEVDTQASGGKWQVKITSKCKKWSLIFE